MYVTFCERPLPDILCPRAIQWVLEVNLAVELHIPLKSKFRLYFVSSKLRLTNYQRKLLSSQMVL